MSDDFLGPDPSDTVRAIAGLARLDLDPDEIAALVDELGAILRSFEVLSEFEPSRGVSDRAAPAPLREDRVDADPLKSPPAELAPDWQDGLFVVPRLRAIDGDSDPGDRG